jgi:hypothetical protein
VELDSYADTGVVVSVDLVNALAARHAHGRPSGESNPLTDLSRILAVDPPSAAQLGERDVPGFRTLAHRLQDVFGDLRAGLLDPAAARLNALLAEHPAHPHLAKEDGHWRLHHHPTDAGLVSMWTSICAEALARLVGGGHEARLGTCTAPACERVFVDLSKNASRRFCSTACQNRVKATAFRRRQTGNSRA